MAWAKGASRCGAGTSSRLISGLVVTARKSSTARVNVGGVAVDGAITED
jgi:hypothetical protein